MRGETLHHELGGACEKYDAPHKAAALKQDAKWNLTVGQELRDSLGYIHRPSQVVPSSQVLSRAFKRTRRETRHGF
jgi:hypothetical protein